MSVDYMWEVVKLNSSQNENVIGSMWEKTPPNNFDLGI